MAWDYDDRDDEYQLRAAPCDMTGILTDQYGNQHDDVCPLCHGEGCEVGPDDDEDDPGPDDDDWRDDLRAIREDDDFPDDI